MPTKTFVQRTTLREQIREQLIQTICEEREGETRKVGVYGLGGAGKSQLARSYLQRYRAHYNATFWIQAGDTPSIHREFLQIYYSLPNAPLQSNSPSAEEVLRAVNSWFVSTGGSWLLVFDGADQLENEKDQHFVDISRYIPGSPNIHVIITSRSSVAKTLSTFEGVRVRELQGSQAVELFCKCSEIITTHQKQVDDVKLIVKELGYLALAITLAGSYISQTPRLSSNLPAYLHEYHQQRREILSEKPNKLIHQYGESVMTVWEMSYLAVQNQLPEACRFLTLLAFLNHEDIFCDLFSQETNASPTLAEHSWVSVIGDEDRIDFAMIEKCFAILERHSLPQRQENGAAYSMHKLVHAWGSDRLKQGNSRQNASDFSMGAFQLLRKAVSNCINTPNAKIRLVPHLRENYTAISKLGGVWGSDKLIYELESIGRFLFDTGYWQEVAAMQRDVLEKRQQIFGKEHQSTLSAMSNLANTLERQVKLDEAAAIHREVLEKWKRILGNKHPDTLVVMNNLAITLNRQNRLDEAAAIQREVLEKLQQILGKEHPNTLTGMGNLAYTLNRQHRLDEAAAMQREVLEKLQQILGKEHPNTLTAMNNLASTLRGQRKLDEAAAIQREALQKLQQILGKEHPNTLTVMNNLACTLGEQGKLDEAAAIQREVLEKR